LLDKDPNKRLGRNGSHEIKCHSFFERIDWDKMLLKAYIPPEPYLKQRFENFLQLSSDKKTNKEVKAAFQKDANTMSSKNLFGQQ
jgi:hypothetical protein